jgi:hypothetical protein
MKSHSTVAYEILREIERLSVDREAKKILVSAHEAVVNILAIELRDALDQLERRYNKSVYLQTVFEYHAEQFEVVSDRVPNRKQTQDIARQLRMERDRTDRREKSKRGRDENRPQRSSEQDRERGDRNERNDRNRDRNRDRDGERERTRETSPNSGKIAPQLPTVKPSGSFITARAAPAAQPSAQPEAQGGVEGAVTESPAFEAPREPVANQEPVDARDFNEMDDEDQLAYLRAQAAQDAAIAGAGNNRAPQSGAGGQPGNSQNRQGRNRNRNRNRGRGNGPQGQNVQGGNRFRPDREPMNRDAESAGGSAPAYEAQGREDGSDS